MVRISFKRGTTSSKLGPKENSLSSVSGTQPLELQEVSSYEKALADKSDAPMVSRSKDTPR